LKLVEAYSSGTRRRGGQGRVLLAMTTISICLNPVCVPFSLYCSWFWMYCIKMYYVIPLPYTDRSMYICMPTQAYSCFAIARSGPPAHHPPQRLQPQAPRRACNPTGGHEPLHAPPPPGVLLMLATNCRPRRRGPRASRCWNDNVGVRELGVDGSCEFMRPCAASTSEPSRAVRRASWVAGRLNRTT